MNIWMRLKRPRGSQTSSSTSSRRGPRRNRLSSASPWAEDGDTIDDATVRWPEDRPQLTFGEMSLTEIAPDNAGEQQHIIFDPIPRVDGIGASADPLFEPRANIYLMTGRRRRAAAKQ